MIQTIRRKLKAFAIHNVVRSAVLKLNHIVFWWYYKRVPNFFYQWTILKSVRLLKDNYEHALFREKGLNEVISGAIKREREMQSEQLADDPRTDFEKGYTKGWSEGFINGKQDKG